MATMSLLNIDLVLPRSLQQFELLSLGNRSGAWNDGRAVDSRNEEVHRVILAQQCQ